MFLNNVSIKGKQISIILKSIKEERANQSYWEKLLSGKAWRLILSLPISFSSFREKKVPVTEALKFYQWILRNLISKKTFSKQWQREKREISLMKWNSTCRKINLINGNPKSDSDDAGLKKEIETYSRNLFFKMGFLFEFIKHLKSMRSLNEKSYQIIVLRVFLFISKVCEIIFYLLTYCPLFIDSMNEVL